MNKFLVMLAKKPVELSCMTCCAVSAIKELLMQDRLSKHTCSR